MLTMREMQKLEDLAQAKGISKRRLMENAGAGVVVALEKHFEKKIGSMYPVIFCGTGNNGGDGLVAARYLSTQCFVFVFLLSCRW